MKERKKIKEKRKKSKLNNKFEKIQQQRVKSARASDFFFNSSKTTHAITLKLSDFYYLPIPLIIETFHLTKAINF